MVRFQDATGRPNFRYFMARGNRQITVDGVPAGAILLRLDNGSFRVYGSTTVTIGEGERRDVHLSLSGQKTRVRVLDHQGRGVSTAYVLLYDPDGGPYTQGETTDSQGECDFLGLPVRTLLAGIVHDTLGNVWGLPFDSPSDPDNEWVELEFVPNASVEVRLVDGDAAIEGIACQLQDSVGRLPVTVWATSDANGRIRWSRLGVGQYRLIHAHNDYWPIDAEVNARTEARSTPIQVRRLGEARFTVRNSAGAPVVGQTIRIRSEEFGADVGDWMRDNRVRAEPATLVTDSNGSLTVSGLPHGLYRWQIDSSELPLGGLFEVPRGSEVLVPVAIH
jgi:hypothetical protein